MDAFVFLLVCLIVLLVLVSRIYGRREGDQLPARQDQRVDRLATILDGDVMEGLTRLARDGQLSEADLANRMLREGIERAEAHPR